MQVSARVQPAPAAWPSLNATAELAGHAGSAEAVRMERGLAQLELERVPANPSRLRIRVDYLRN